jgi:hypothetical protein
MQIKLRYTATVSRSIVEVARLLKETTDLSAIECMSLSEKVIYNSWIPNRVITAELRNDVDSSQAKTKFHQVDVDIDLMDGIRN